MTSADAHHPAQPAIWIPENSLPYLTADLPGTGGILKQELEDFVVEEVPAYLPEGAGEFVYLWVEKRGLSGEQLTSHLARMLGIAHQDIGMAGLKDRQGVTRQWVSVPARCEAKLPQIEHPQMTVLQSARHRNKLRTGHLRGNRFQIVLRNTHPEGLARAEAIAARINNEGFPNYFGDQRFGRDNETLQLGLDLLCGRRTPGSIPRARRKFLLRLSLSAVQSALFNAALADRLGSGRLKQVELGDVMQVTASGGPFVVEDVPREQSRYAARETVISGPIPGPKMKQPTHAVGQQEAALLEKAGLTVASFEQFSNLTPGTRRPYLVWPEELQVSLHPAGLHLSFSLSSGSYATILLREFQKPV